MPSVEERVAYLEGLVEDHGRAQAGLGERIDRLSNRIDGLAGRIDAVDAKVDRFREELAARLDVLAARVDSVDAKVDRFREELSAKMSHQFGWLVGIQVSVLVAVIGALVAA